MPSWPSGKMSAVVPSCCPWSRATTGCPSSSLTWNRGGSGEAWKSPAAGASACRIRTGTARCGSAAAGAQGRGGAAGAIFSSSPSWVVVRIARSIGLRGNAETGANCAGAVSGPAGGDSPRRWLAAEREADVKAPSITPVPRSSAAIRMPVNRARLWRHAGSWSRVRSLRHREQTRRRAISGWRIRMAVPQPPQAMTTGSMASLVSRVCLKEFVEGVLFSLAACSACAKPVARIAVGHGQLVAGAG